MSDDSRTMSYPGGKAGAGVYQKIINLMPPHSVYIEPFLGGAAIMKAKRPALFNIGIDLDVAAITSAALAMPPGDTGSGRRIGDLRAVSAPLSDFKARRRRSPVSAMSDRGSARVAMPAAAPDLTVKYSRPRSLFSALADPHAKSGDTRSRFSLTVGDGIEYLESYTFTGDELVYCDPPYLLETRRSSRDLYRFEMSGLEHRRLLRVLLKLPCRVMLSGYHSPLYAKALRGWHSIHFEAMTRGGRTATEWLWFNFAKPLELHDYRYLGENFRERERITRKTKRWTARLQRMPELEKQALLAAIASVANSGDGRSLRQLRNA